MGFKCAIVGLPNVGKSTIFNALTNAKIAAQNYPFCTIEPNVGIVAVPDTRLNKLQQLVQPEKVIPTNMEFVDVAGLVKGAAQGEGLGNKFLANIRATDAIAHVVRCFEDNDIIHVNAKVSPLDDIEIINTELLLADLETVSKQLTKAKKNSKSGNKELLAEIAMLEQLQQHLSDGVPARTFNGASTQDLQVRFEQLQLLTAKPMMYIANVDANSMLEGNEYTEKVAALAKKENAELVIVSATIEAELIELEPDERVEFLQELGMQGTGLDRIINTGYKLLNLHTYFTAGVKEVRAWTIPLNSTAPQAAGKIHTDFEKGFIRAEVVSYSDFIAHNGEAGAKDAGRWRLEGKEYIVADGDVIHFRFNV